MTKDFKKFNLSSSSIASLMMTMLWLLFVPACATSQQPQQVVVAPIGAEGQVAGTGITREELEDHVRRFADRYITRVALATNTLVNTTDDQEIDRLAQEWKSVSYAAIVDIAIGPNAVTNLLDMMVLTRLSRLVVEDYWAPEVLGAELGAGFLQTFIDLEDDIWLVADDVLTEEQQRELRALVDEWHADNSEQVYPWYMRLSNFSGQRAASIAAVQQTGGLLREVARAREAAEEIQAFGERVLFYLQRAPMITSLELETSANDILEGPRISRTLDDVERFVTAVETLAATVERLPGTNLAAVDQIMDRLAAERLALFQGVRASEPEITGVLADLLPVLQSIERTVEVAKQRNPGARSFDITEYSTFASQSAATATEIRLLVESLEQLSQGSGEMRTLIDALVEAEHAMVDRAFFAATALIFIFFAALLVYRIITARFLPR